MSERIVRVTLELKVTGLDDERLIKDFKNHTSHMTLEDFKERHYTGFHFPDEGKAYPEGADVEAINCEVYEVCPPST